MILCKDCFHREVCEAWTTIKLDDIPPEIPCFHFKDTADVAPRAEVLEAVYEFKNDLIDVFIGLCEGNDYNRLNLLKIGDTVARVYNKHITELKKKYTGETEPQGGEKS